MALQEPIKNLYVVRHGQSELNGKARAQFPDTPLSREGEAQAAELADRFLHIDIDRIFASTMTRAMSTAEMVAQKIGKDITPTDHFRELKRPSSTLGLKYTDPKLVTIHEELMEHYRDPDWHHSDEENLFDFYRRVKEGVDLILAAPEKNVAVVSHAFCINMLFATLLLKTPAEAVEAHVSLRHLMHINNTSITLFEYREFWGSKVWQLRAWNDDAHLG